MQRADSGAQRDAMLLRRGGGRASSPPHQISLRRFLLLNRTLSASIAGGADGGWHGSGERADLLVRTRRRRLVFALLTVLGIPIEVRTAFGALSVAEHCSQKKCPPLGGTHSFVASFTFHAQPCSLAGCRSIQRGFLPLSGGYFFSAIEKIAAAQGRFQCRRLVLQSISCTRAASASMPAAERSSLARLWRAAHWCKWVLCERAYSGS